MKKHLAVLATITTAAAGVLTIPPPAQADSPGCVTLTEYLRVARGNSPQKVATLFDTKGTVIYDKTESYEEPNPGGGTLVTWYRVVVRSLNRPGMSGDSLV